MKTILKILFLCGIILLTAFSCEKEEENCDMDNAQHVETFYSDEFERIPCSLHNIDTDNKVVNLVIKTQADFEKYLSCSSQLPAIDFKKYFILVGRYRHHQCAIFDSQEVLICDNKLFYKVRMLEQDCLAFTDVFYVTVIEREYVNLPVKFDVKFMN
jgi:hypothetical protein